MPRWGIYPFLRAVNGKAKMAPFQAIRLSLLRKAGWEMNFGLSTALASSAILSQSMGMDGCATLSISRNGKRLSASLRRAERPLCGQIKSGQRTVTVR